MSLTHKEVDKMVGWQREAAGRPSGSREQWVIKTDPPATPRGSYSLTWPSDVAYWGTRNDGTPGLTPYVGNSSRYVSEDDALYHGYQFKEAGRIGDFVVEKLLFNPRRYSLAVPGERRSVPVGTIPRGK